MYHQHADPPPTYYTADVKGQPEENVVDSSGSCFKARPGWKRIHMYRNDSSRSHSLVHSDGTPLYTVIMAIFHTADYLLLPYQPPHTTETTPPSLASSRGHLFSSRIDLCYGDYKTKENPWDSYAMEKDSGYVKKTNERWRWGLDASLLPPELRPVHPGMADEKYGGGGKKVEFIWQRAADSAFTLSSWEMIIDRDGRGNGEVLMRFKQPDMSLKKKGDIEMVEGAGEAWEYLAYITLASLIGNERDQVAEYVAQHG